MARQVRKKSLFTPIITFIATLVVVFFGFQFITKTGIFKIPGVVTYDESLTAEEIAILNGIFTEEIVLDKDVTISATETYELPALTDGQFLYQVSVPITDFYDAATSVVSEESHALKFISVEELDPSHKLLALDGHYYLDDFTSGAKFRIITFASDKYAEEIAPLVADTFTKTYPTKDTVLTFAQTGVTALSRGMLTKLNATGGDATYFATNIKDYLSGFDLTHISNESSFSSYANSRNICSDQRFIDTITSIGTDIVELTGNHNQDCGDEAARNTIDTYLELGLKTVGGGKTATLAAEPLLINQKDTGITMLAYNESTGGATTDGTPGANQYYETDVVKNITAAKERGDFVIVDIQYYECIWYDDTSENTTCDRANSSAGDQIGFFRHLIDLGADLVVGTSAHQPQTFELYKDKPIYYGLGNLFFDQVWWPGTTRSLILAHYFYNGNLLQTKIVPTVYDNSMRTTLMNEETSQWFIKRLASVHP